jgi:hypothetical protein
MTASSIILIKTIYPCPRVIWVDLDRNISTGRRALRNPSSSNTRSSRRKNIWKDSYEKYCKDQHNTY